MHRIQDGDDVRGAGFVEQLKRPAGVAAAEHHRGVDVGGAGITVLDHADRIVELRVGQRLDEEAGPVPGDDRPQPDPGRERGRLGGRARRGHIGQDQLGEPQLAGECLDDVDTDHIGRVACGQGRVQDPVARVCRHDDQAGLVGWLRHDADAGRLIASASSSSRPPESLITATASGTGASSWSAAVLCLW